ncbi:GD14096 [Drosophila simulans]|uniref:GD14096 n=1 Tax=Drosophila simulans TaxID=7240 RepID=B4QM31_DROSI|nr:GD14096 [Drosophila simulans]
MRPARYASKYSTPQRLPRPIYHAPVPIPKLLIRVKGLLPDRVHRHRQRLLRSVFDDNAPAPAPTASQCPSSDSAIS